MTVQASDAMTRKALSHGVSRRRPSKYVGTRRTKQPNRRSYVVVTTNLAMRKVCDAHSTLASSLSSGSEMSSASSWILTHKLSRLDHVTDFSRSDPSLAAFKMDFKETHSSVDGKQQQQKH